MEGGRVRAGAQALRKSGADQAVRQAGGVAQRAGIRGAAGPLPGEMEELSRKKVIGKWADAPGARPPEGGTPP